MIDDLLPVDPARVMFAQARPALADRNGRGGQGSPTKEELRKIIADRDRVIAEKENMIAQDRANKEKAKKARTEAYSQGQPAYTPAQTEAYQKRCQKRAAALEAQGEGARKKPSPQKAQQQPGEPGPTQTTTNITSRKLGQSRPSCSIVCGSTNQHNHPSPRRAP